MSELAEPVPDEQANEPAEIRVRARVVPAARVGPTAGSWPTVVADQFSRVLSMCWPVA
jgi:hypothetical protein